MEQWEIRQLEGKRAAVLAQVQELIAALTKLDVAQVDQAYWIFEECAQQVRDARVRVEHRARVNA